MSKPEGKSAPKMPARSKLRRRAVGLKVLDVDAVDLTQSA